jgi:CheY-like chemotaxis protein
MSAAATATRSYHETNRCVLVVDDDRLARNAVVEHLRILGYETLEASSGFEAIRMAATHRPAVVVVDGLLPNMHGFEVSRFIRASDVTYSPRIIMVTGVYKNVRYRNDARLKYGIDSYLHKPVSREALGAALVN